MSNLCDTELMLSLATIVAIILGPILALEISRRFEKTREQKAKQLQLFRDLMATRKIQMDPLHVAALNVVELEFFGNAEIVNAFRGYISHLYSPLPEVSEQDRYFSQRNDLFVELVYEIGTQLGYNFDKHDLTRRSYAPVGWENDQSMQRQNAALLSEILQGKRGLPISQYVNQGNSPYPPPPEKK